MAKTIVFFNNKGGVGKTTLTANIAAFLAIEQDKRVCVIDCDPQCNITQLLIGDSKTIDLYWSSAKSKQSTIMDVVNPIIEGDSSIDSSVKAIPSYENRFGVDLLPGNPKFSALEDDLSRGWSDLLAMKTGGFRTTNWLRSYIKNRGVDYDYIFVDVGPSLGPINRSILLCADFFVTPLGSDIFSLLGVRNIATWKKKWLSEYNRAVSNFCSEDDSNADKLKNYDVPLVPPIASGFVGYTLQQYISKTRDGVRRPTKAFEQIIAKAPSEIHKHLMPSLNPTVKKIETNLGDIPNLFSIIPLAQSVNAPIFALLHGDGLVGSQYQQVTRYSELIGNVGLRLMKNVK